MTNKSKEFDYEAYLTHDYKQLFEQCKNSNVDIVERGIRMVLEGLGFGASLRDGLSQTPIRVANMLLGLTQPERFNTMTFDVDDDSEHGVTYDEVNYPALKGEACLKSKIGLG